MFFSNWPLNMGRTLSTPILGAKPLAGEGRWVKSISSRKPISKLTQLVSLVFTSITAIANPGNDKASTTAPIQYFPRLHFFFRFMTPPRELVLDNRKRGTDGRADLHSTF